MFPQVVKVRSGPRTYEYLRILESYREGGVSKHRVVANLGRVDKLDGKLDALVQSLSKYCEERLVAPSQVTCEDALPWGPILLARHLYDQLGLGQIVRTHCQGRRDFDVGETAFVLIANRLIDPRSEHGLARWLERNYVCDGSGVRWNAAWRPEESVTKEQRVRVRSGQLNRWYRTLDALLSGKSEIEKALYLKVRDLFSLDVDMVLYDITSTYFERRRPKEELRRHGKSRDGKPRNVQVLLGVVMANGFPIAHHVFAGNTPDKATFQSTLTDLEDRFGLRRVLVVGDRGFVSQDNLAFLAEEGREMRYLLGIPGRRCEESAAVLDRVREEAWKTVDDTNRVQEVTLQAPDVRYFVVESQERKAYEQEQRERSMESVAEALGRVEAAVKRGNPKRPVKIAARAERAICRNHGKRYYSYEIPAPGAFHFYVDPDKLQAETRREGIYIIKTNDMRLTPKQSVGRYKQLSDVEWAYRDLKDVIRMRPIYHRRDDRIQAHLLVATLALFLKRTLEHQLDAKNLYLTPTEAFDALHSVGISVLDFNGQTKHLTSGGGPDARRVLKALDITQITPPGTD